MQKNSDIALKKNQQGLQIVTWSRNMAHKSGKRFCPDIPEKRLDKADVILYITSKECKLQLERSVRDAEEHRKCREYVKNLYLRGIRDGEVQEVLDNCMGNNGHLPF